jgi:hypothetical protein
VSLTRAHPGDADVGLTRRSAAEIAAVRHLRRALADVAIEASMPRYAAEVRGSRASRSDRAPAGAVDNRPAALRSRLCATLGRLGLVVVCFGGVLVALSSRRAFNASAAVVVIAVGVALGAAAALRCWWDVAHLTSLGEQPGPPDGTLQRARSRWLCFVKKGELTEVPLTGASGRGLVRPDDRWWTTRNE